MSRTARQKCCTHRDRRPLAPACEQPGTKLTTGRQQSEQLSAPIVQCEYSAAARSPCGRGQTCPGAPGKYSPQPCSCQIRGRPAHPSSGACQKEGKRTHDAPPARALHRPWNGALHRGMWGVLRARDPLRRVQANVSRILALRVIRRQLVEALCRGKCCRGNRESYAKIRHPTSFPHPAQHLANLRTASRRVSPN